VLAGLGSAAIVVASVAGVGAVRAGASDESGGGDDVPGDHGPGGMGGFRGDGQDGGWGPGGRGGRGGRGGWGGAAGTVSGVDGSTITVETDGGDVTVATDDDTTFREVSTLDVADIEDGDTVRVVGDGGEDAVEAWHVVVGAGLGDHDDDDEGDGEDRERSDHGPGRFHGVTGTVRDAGDNGFTVETDDGDVAVTTTEDTRATEVAEASLDDVDDGDTVLVHGATGDDDQVDAEAVVLGDVGWHGGDDTDAEPS
jgi:hypothetical protein